MKTIIYDKDGNKMDIELNAKELWVVAYTKDEKSYLIHITATEWKVYKKFITFKNIIKIWRARRK